MKRRKCGRERDRKMRSGREKREEKSKGVRGGQGEVRRPRKHPH